MRRLVSAVVFCLLTASFAGAAPKVAVVYSTWGEYAFRDEFDPHLKALGWTNEQIRERFGFSEIMMQTLERDPTANSDEALLEIYRRLRPGEPLRRSDQNYAAECECFGSDNTVWIARLLWETPNRFPVWMKSAD